MDFRYSEGATSTCFRFNRDTCELNNFVDYYQVGDLDRK